MKLKSLCAVFFVYCFLTGGLFSGVEAAIYLKENLKRGQPGDFIVAAQNKSYTLLHLVDKKDHLLTVEEITVPSESIARNQFSWRDWVGKGAPSHTSWILYTISLETSEIQSCYSLSKNGWYAISCKDIFLPTLLNLRLNEIPKNERKLIGPPPDEGSPDRRQIWQPTMMVDGKTIKNVSFSAWRTRWPKDNGSLSGKPIEIYLPEESDKYPSYFPYWLQIKGIVGQAKLRIVDSGTRLNSSTPPLPINTLSPNN